MIYETIDMMIHISYCFVIDVLPIGKRFLVELERLSRK